MIHRIGVSAEIDYTVLIGRGLLAELVATTHHSMRVAVIHPSALRQSAELIQSELEDAGKIVILIEVPEAEDSKTAAVVEFCWNALGASGFTRSDMVIGLGGGATTDVAGFVAATWLRGISWVAVPTTLLGMVDASVGGKTGINTEAGKNLVGSFHSPQAVIVDLNSLQSLPENDLRAGLAEVAKVGFTSDPSILDTIVQFPHRIVDPESEQLESLITRSVTVKATVVSSDFTEQGGVGGSLGREVLNYGHTFGHAVEKYENYRWRHGAAVSVGIMYVAELAHIAGRLSSADVDRHREVLGIIGLPLTYPAGRWDQLYSTMLLDKKSRGSLLRFVVLDSIGVPAILEGPDPSLLVAAYSSINPD
ncbi:MAG: 3-dehydroquinate synthase [Candidatus Nanopelagicales bacterium]|nr:3-dehydroquinate synthase [Candidatus Nanopelagicales bacterium]